MKIDLHVHTRKIKNKDTLDRNIEPEEFCKIMEEANVGIVGITNHNKFDFVQYEKIKKVLHYKQQNLLLILGIEIDIVLPSNDKNKKRRRQMNILFSQEDMEDFRKFHNHFFKNDYNKGNLNEISLSEFKDYILKECKKNEIILYIDSKKLNENRNHKTTSFSTDEIKKYLNELNNELNICIVRDTNSYKNYEFLIHWKEKSLIGSDNENWKDYVKKSDSLLEYNILIKDFSSLFSVFKNGENYETFQKLGIKIEFEKLEIISKQEDKKNTGFFVNNLNIIEKTMNVIFGPKSSGKTDLLYSIYSNLDVSNDKKEFYEAKDKKEFLEKYLNKNYFEKEKDDFVKTFQFILNYKEEKINFPNFYDWANQKSDNFFFQLANCELKHEIGNFKIIVEDVEEIRKDLLSAWKKMNNISSYYEKEYDIKKDILSLRKLIKSNADFWIYLNKENFKYNVNEKIKEGLVQILKQFKNKITEPTSIGLFKKFDERSSLFIKLRELNNNFFRKQFIKELDTYEIPSDNDDKLKKLILKYKLIFKFNKSKESSKYKKQLSNLIKNYCLDKKFIDPSENLENLDEEKIDYKFHFVEERIDNNFIFFDEEKNEIKLSKGEQYYLNLISFLNSDLDYYFLDEPETSLNNNFISKVIQKRINDMILYSGKTFVITTHNSILGINTKSMNFIFRDNKNTDTKGNYETFMGNIQEKFLFNLSDKKEETTKNIREKLLECFEGDKKNYEYRKKVYEIDELKKEKTEKWKH